MTRNKLLLLIISGILAGCGTTADNGGIGKTFVVDPPSIAVADSLTVIPGPEYKAGWLHEALFGKHYRDIWTSPAKVKVLDLETFAGGLTPIKQGGGFQTKSLRFQGKDGRQYAFRSTNKDPKAVLPLELRETFAADIVQDQISSSNPSAALVVDVFADALGVLHPKPLIVIMPDDSRLGEFRSTFSGVLGIIEEYPADGPDGTPGFAGSDKIVSTIKLYEALEKDNDNQVNAEALLTARLLDVFVGDWDRHIDQWRWARFKENGRNVWYPIPRDRDQAFALFDGLFPLIGARAITQFHHFYEKFGDMNSLTFSGRFVDRRLLVSLDKKRWDTVVQNLIGKLTDEVTEQAVQQLPPEHYALRGKWLTSTLKSRRNTLKHAADEYYELLSDYVDVHFSDKAELVDVNRLDDGSTEIVAYDLKQSGERGDELFRRTFLTSETAEVRLYLHGGDDKCTITGNGGTSIVVRVIGGGGDDELTDKTQGRGIYFYDDKGENRITAGPRTVVDTRKYEPPPPGLVQY